MSIPFVQIKNEAARLAEDTSSSAEIKIKDWINQWYERLWRAYNWKEIMIIDRAVSVASGEQTVTLDRDFGQLIALTERTMNIILTQRSPFVYQEQYLSQQAAAAGPIGFTPSGRTGIKTDLSSNATVRLRSSSASDTMTARVYGTDGSGNITSEKVTLTGTSNVNTATTFSSVSNAVLSDLPVGTIYVEDSSGTELAEIEYGTFCSNYLKYRLNAPTDAAYTLYATGKQSFKRLVNDEDTTSFSVESALVRFAASEFQRIRKRYDQAKDLERIGHQFVDDLIAERDVLDSGFQFPNVLRSFERYDYPLHAGGKW